MTVLVTGGCGFIGSHIVEKLIEKGYKVRVMGLECHLENINHLIPSPNIEFVRKDVKDPIAVSKTVEGVDSIIHLAALINVDESWNVPRAFWETNVLGTFNVLESARNEGVSKLVYLSTCEVYGHIPDGKADENFPTVPRSPYAASKLAAERYCFAYYVTYGRPEVVIVRAFNTFGPRQNYGQWGAVIPRFIMKVLNSEAPTIFGDGKQTRDYVYVEDTADGIVEALEKPSIGGETINIATGEEHSILEIAEKIIDFCGRKNLQPVFVAPRPGEVRRSVGDSSKARRLLGWQVKYTFDERLRHTIDFFKLLRESIGS